MEIKVSGKPKNINKKEIKLLTDFFGGLLIKKNLLDKLYININFQNLEPGYHAFCMVDENEPYNKPREFSIDIEKTLSRKEIIIALGHEMVHIKQYATGQLKEPSKKNVVIWKGEEHPPMSGDTLSLKDMNAEPWETEAYGLEPRLWYSYKKYFKNSSMAVNARKQKG